VNNKAPTQDFLSERMDERKRERKGEERGPGWAVVNEDEISHEVPAVAASISPAG
jgi:hypothetical protein